MSHRYCPNCGWELDEDDEYCVQCGQETPLDDALYDDFFSPIYGDDCDLMYEEPQESYEDTSLPEEESQKPSLLTAYMDVFADSLYLSSITPIPLLSYNFKAEKGTRNQYYSPYRVGDDPNKTIDTRGNRASNLDVQGNELPLHEIQKKAAAFPGTQENVTAVTHTQSIPEKQVALTGPSTVYTGIIILLWIFGMIFFYILEPVTMMFMVVGTFISLYFISIKPILISFILSLIVLFYH